MNNIEKLIQRFPDFIRWLFFLPISILLSALVFLAVKYGLLYYGFLQTIFIADLSKLQLYLHQIAPDFSLSFSFSYISIKIAPKLQKIISITTCVLINITCLFLFAYTNFENLIDYFGLLATGIGAIVATYQTFREYE